MAFENTEQYAAYYQSRIDYWTAKLAKFIAPSKKARAKRRIAHYKGKLDALNA